jgi:ABC-type Fe3+ transport system permease subunit
VRRNTRAVWAAVLGVLSALTMPVAIFATRYSKSYELIQAGFAIPIALALGIAAVVLARKARAYDQATLGKAGGGKRGRVGRWLGVLGICMAASATIAVIVYEVLVSVE